MIIIIILSVVFLISIALIIWGANHDNDVQCCGIFLGILFGLGLFLSLSVGTITSKNVDSYRNESKRISLNETIEELNATYESLINTQNSSNTINRTDIVEYNNKVRNFKNSVKQGQLNLKNPWINWYVSVVWNEYSEDQVTYFIYDGE